MNFSIREHCTPRSDLLSGTFNPEVFTAILSRVIDHYRGRDVPENIYTDPEAFFKEATYPTKGLQNVLTTVFGRISGDGTFPAIQRLETAFGGGKTHTLIAATHIAYRGRELRGLTSDFLDASLLPEPGSVSVVGVAGDELPVHKPQGAELVPHTLWGEIAHQLGGEELYRSVEEEASAAAAPGKSFLKTIFEGRKVILMLDELAQYAARLQAANRDGPNQLAAFLMTLNGYAREHSSIAVVLTLASTADAFGTQTERLAELLSQVAGEDVSEDAAVGEAEKAVEGIASVVARDATSVVPVQAGEISSVLAKRLFTQIDPQAAEATATAYKEMYDKSRSLLPEEAVRPDFQDRMKANYPFHPALLRFLNSKLATAESFQGTRGVLRTLALVVRNLYAADDEIPIPMVHPCHLDLSDDRIVNELVNRTRAADLLPIINADVGGVDTEQLAGERSNAQLADLRNPHPDGFPMYEYTWRTVFLHSLVGREAGLSSNLFGIGERDALFHTAFPGLTPPQVAEALKEIKDTAYYLREQDGRYYASLDPSVNKALGNIRRNLDKESVDQLLSATARKVVKDDPTTFRVVHDVLRPGDVPDDESQPVLSLLSLDAGEIKADDFVTFAGPNRPRKAQNHVFLLVPDTVVVEEVKTGQSDFFDSQREKAEEVRQRLDDQARWVLAMRRLRDRPQEYGINPRWLEDEEFQSRYREREHALQTTVSEAYTSLWFPAASGSLTREDVRTAGGEGGTPTIERIRTVLKAEGELVTEADTGQSQLQSLAELLFGSGDTIEISAVRQNFARIRRWPILEQPDLLDRLLREGVRKGTWCIFKMGGAERKHPEEIYHRQSDVPLDLDLRGEGYSLITVSGAKQRGWLEPEGPRAEDIKKWVGDTVYGEGVATVSAIAEKVQEQYGDVSESDVEDAVADLVREGRACAYEGSPEQEDAPPELLTGSRAALLAPTEATVVITNAEASTRGWLKEEARALTLSGGEATEVLFGLLDRIGSLYNRGADSTIRTLDLTELELPKGGRLRVTLTDATPESMRTLAEFFQDVANVSTTGDSSEAFLTIPEPDDECLLIQELRAALSSQEEQ